MSDGVLGPLLIIALFVVFFAVATPLVYALNVHVIGPSYDRKAADLFTRVAATERTLYEEYDLAMILSSRAIAAVGRSYKRANVRITPGQKHTLVLEPKGDAITALEAAMYGK